MKGVNKPEVEKKQPRFRTTQHPSFLTSLDSPPRSRESGSTTINVCCREVSQIKTRTSSSSVIINEDEELLLKRSLQLPKASSSKSLKVARFKNEKSRSKSEQTLSNLAVCEVGSLSLQDLKGELWLSVPRQSSDVALLETKVHVKPFLSVQAIYEGDFRTGQETEKSEEHKPLPGEDVTENDFDSEYPTYHEDLTETPAKVSSTDYDSADDAPTMSDYKVSSSQKRIRVVRALQRSLLTVDFKICLMYSLLKMDSPPSPFPEDKWPNNRSGRAKVREIINRFPTAELLAEMISTQRIGKDKELIDLLHWLLHVLNEPSIHPVKKQQGLKIMRDVSYNPFEVDYPKIFFKVNVSQEQEDKWVTKKGSYPSRLGYFPTKLDEVLYILAYGLDERVRTDGFFDEGLYLTKCIDWAYANSQTSSVWKKSRIGNKLTVVAMVEIIEGPETRIRRLKDPFGIKEDMSKVPIIYYVPDKELTILRYLLVWSDRKTVKEKKATSSGVSRTLLYSFVLLSLGYATFKLLQKKEVAIKDALTRIYKLLQPSPETIIT